ncbi:MAG TPA: hypothetical protein PLJ21_08275 [Pseudobdellovibrionaceae bacterium]|nr:hypothetical protein [Pseudobdellovibrionaceae bacterium]
MKKETENKKYRKASRKEIAKLHLNRISNMDNLSKIASEGVVTQISATGILLMVKRTHLVPQYLRQNLNLDALLGVRLLIHIHELNLEISGTVSRTAFKGTHGFLIALDFSNDAPAYWRECLVELLPTETEVSQF